jgi:hypothetical protein
MAPEQLQDFRNAPTVADIFALGCILHDCVDPNSWRRIPYSQIRISGRYGLIIERCTEQEPKQRFPTIAALRAALFDVWRISESPTPDMDTTTLLEAVEANPDSREAWRALIGHIENADLETKNALLKGINSALIISLSGVDEVLMSRLIDLLCDWAAGTNFDFVYCDVVGDRLLDAYKVTPVRMQYKIVLAALDLAVSHNRWHVMDQVGAMLSPAADNGLVDRILIEMNLNPGIETGLRTIERVVYWERNKWHSKIANFLTQGDPPLPF